MRKTKKIRLSSASNVCSLEAQIT